MSSRERTMLLSQRIRFKKKKHFVGVFIWKKTATLYCDCKLFAFIAKQLLAWMWQSQRKSWILRITVLNLSVLLTNVLPYSSTSCRCVLGEFPIISGEAAAQGAGTWRPGALDVGVLWSLVREVLWENWPWVSSMRIAVWVVEVTITKMCVAAPMYIYILNSDL